MIHHETAILGVECVCVGEGYEAVPEENDPAYFELHQVLVAGVNIIELLDGDMIEQIETQVFDEIKGDANEY